MATKVSPASVPPRDPRQVESWVSPSDAPADDPARPIGAALVEQAAKHLADAAELLTHAYAAARDGRIVNDLDFARNSARLLAEHVALIQDRARREGGGA